MNDRHKEMEKVPALSFRCIILSIYLIGLVVKADNIIPFNVIHPAQMFPSRVQELNV